VERLTIELVDYRSAVAPHDARYVDPCGSEFQIRFEINPQEQCLAKFGACGPEDGEMIAEGRACLARDNRFKRDPLSFVRTLVDNDLALAVSLRDLTGPLVKRRPIQARERRIIEMAFNDVADEGRLTKAVCARQVELAAAVRSAITVIISFALE
jgi:hypothetical protein